MDFHSKLFTLMHATEEKGNIMPGFSSVSAYGLCYDSYPSIYLGLGMYQALPRNHLKTMDHCLLQLVPRLDKSNRLFCLQILQFDQVFGLYFCTNVVFTIVHVCDLCR